jgi:hypothetical protein
VVILNDEGSEKYVIDCVPSKGTGYFALRDFSISREEYDGCSEVLESEQACSSSFFVSGL